MLICHSGQTFRLPAYGCIGLLCLPLWQEPDGEPHKSVLWLLFSRTGSDVLPIMIIMSERQEAVLTYLREHDIPFSCYNHPEGKTIEEAKRWWKDDGSVHCKNIFMRNHKGNQHYLICFHCDHDLDIHDLEARLKEALQSQGKPSCGKLSFASPERMMRYLGLEPGSVSPFGLINDCEHHVQLFLDAALLDDGNYRNPDCKTLSFHPNDCRGTVVISLADFERYLATLGNKYEYLRLY